MVWNLTESSGFPVSIYTSRHKTTKAHVVNAQGEEQQAQGGVSQTLLIFIKSTTVFWVNLINVIHKVLGK